MSTLIAEHHSSGQPPHYRVWHAYNVPNNMDYYAVAGPKEAEALIRQLTLADLKDPCVVTNAFGLEELEADGYHEWYDPEGKDILFEEEVK